MRSGHIRGCEEDVGVNRVAPCADSDTIIAIHVGTKNSPIDMAPSTTKTPSNTTITTRDR